MDKKGFVVWDGTLIAVPDELVNLLLPEARARMEYGYQVKTINGDWVIIRNGLAQVLCDAVKAGHKLQAIQVLRMVHAVGLKEAKEFVEAL